MYQRELGCGSWACLNCFRTGSSGWLLCWRCLTFSSVGELTEQKCPLLNRKHWITKWSTVLLEKLVVTHKVKKFPAFYGTRRFITVFTRSPHWSLFWAQSVQSTTSHSISLRFVLILSSNLRLVSSFWSLPFRFSAQNFIRISHVFIRATWPAHLILLDLIIQIRDSKDTHVEVFVSNPELLCARVRWM